LSGDGGQPDPAGELEQGVHDAFASEDPKEVEAAQGIEGKQALGLRGRGVHGLEIEEDGGGSTE
jgi:hypothetical protein